MKKNEKKVSSQYILDNLQNEIEININIRINKPENNEQNGVLNNSTNQNKSNTLERNHINKLLTQNNYIHGKSGDGNLVLVFQKSHSHNTIEPIKIESDGTTNTYCKETKEILNSFENYYLNFIHNIINEPKIQILSQNENKEYTFIANESKISTSNKINTHELSNYVTNENIMKIMTNLNSIKCNSRDEYLSLTNMESVYFLLSFLFNQINCNASIPLLLEYIIKLPDLNVYDNKKRLYQIDWPNSKAKNSIPNNTHAEKEIKENLAENNEKVQAEKNQESSVGIVSTFMIKNYDCTFINLKKPKKTIYNESMVLLFYLSEKYIETTLKILNKKENINKEIKMAKRNESTKKTANISILKENELKLFKEENNQNALENANLKDESKESSANPGENNLLQKNENSHTNTSSIVPIRDNKNITASTDVTSNNDIKEHLPIYVPNSIESKFDSDKRHLICLKMYFEELSNNNNIRKLFRRENSTPNENGADINDSDDNSEVNDSYIDTMTFYINSDGFVVINDKKIKVGKINVPIDIDEDGKIILTRYNIPYEYAFLEEYGIKNKYRYERIDKNEHLADEIFTLTDKTYENPEILIEKHDAEYLFYGYFKRKTNVESFIPPKVHGFRYTCIRKVLQTYQIDIRPSKIKLDDIKPSTMFEIRDKMLNALNDCEFFEKLQDFTLIPSFLKHKTSELRDEIPQVCFDIIDKVRKEILSTKRLFINSPHCGEINDEIAEYIKSKKKFELYLYDHHQLLAGLLQYIREDLDGLIPKIIVSKFAKLIKVDDVENIEKCILLLILIPLFMTPNKRKLLKELFSLGDLIEENKSQIESSRKSVIYILSLNIFHQHMCFTDEYECYIRKLNYILDHLWKLDLDYLPKFFESFKLDI